MSTEFDRLTGTTQNITIVGLSGCIHFEAILSAYGLLT